LKNCNNNLFNKPNNSLINESNNTIYKSSLICKVEEKKSIESKHFQGETKMDHFIHDHLGLDLAIHINENVSLDDIYANILNSVEVSNPSLDLITAENLKLIEKHSINHMFSYSNYVRSQQDFDTSIFKTYIRPNKVTPYFLVSIDCEMMICSVLDVLISSRLMIRLPYAKLHSFMDSSYFSIIVLVKKSSFSSDSISFSIFSLGFIVLALALKSCINFLALFISSRDLTYCGSGFKVLIFTSI
jgi:hypothetical protein